MLRILKSCVHWMGRWYIQKINKSLWESQNPKRLNERPVEYGFAFTCLSQVAPRAVLDVGTGTTALPSLLTICGYHVMAIDNIRDYWPQGMFNRHFYVLDDDITHTKLHQQFDMVLCISVLEHIINYEQALEGMTSLTKPGGHLVITCPYNEHLGSANVYKQRGSYGKGNPYGCKQFTRDDFQKWLGSSRCAIARQEWWQCFDSDYWSCGNQILPPRKVSAEQQHQHTCLLIQRPR